MKLFEFFFIQSGTNLQLIAEQNRLYLQFDIDIDLFGNLYNWKLGWHKLLTKNFLLKIVNLYVFKTKPM